MQIPFFPLWRYLKVTPDGIGYTVRLKMPEGVVLAPDLSTDPRDLVGHGLSKKEAAADLYQQLVDWLALLPASARERLTDWQKEVLEHLPVRTRSSFIFTSGTSAGTSYTFKTGDAVAVSWPPQIILQPVGWQEGQGRAHVVLQVNHETRVACQPLPVSGRPSPMSRPTRLPKCKQCLRILQNWRLPVGQKAYRVASAS